MGQTEKATSKDNLCQMVASGKKETYSNEVEETEKMLVQLMSELEGRQPPKSRLPCISIGG